MTLILWGLILSCLSGILGVLGKALSGGKRVIPFHFSMITGSLLILWRAVPVMMGAQPLQATLPFWNTSLVLDSLSALFVSLSALIVIISTIFAGGYRKSPEKTSMMVSWGVFCSALTALPLARDIILFLVLWETMTAASLFMIMDDRQSHEAKSAAAYYLAAATVCGSLLMTGFAIAMARAGSWQFEKISEFMLGNGGNSGSVMAAAIFLIAGFALKSGLLPFHSWLPRAHPAAPGHVSAIMSGLMVNAGTYGLLRTWQLFPLVKTGPFIIILGCLTALHGIFQAFAQKDYKRFLAFSTMENLGLIWAGFGLFMAAGAQGDGITAILAGTGALALTVLHSLAKTCLFMGAAAVHKAYHTRNMEELGGAIRDLPAQGTTTCLAAASLAGLPPLGGFLAEMSILLAFFSCLHTQMSVLTPAQGHSLWITATIALAAALLSLVAGCSLAAFARYLSVVFLGHRRSSVKFEGKQSPLMIWPMALCAGLLVLIGLHPVLLGKALIPSLSQLAGKGFWQNGLSQSAEAMGDLILPTLKGWGTMSCTLLLVTTLLVLFRWVISRGEERQDPTWVCGYTAGDATMQYTAVSFNQPFTSLAPGLTGTTCQVHCSPDPFPASLKMDINSGDPTESLFITPLSEWWRSLLDRFAWVQSGDTRRYVLYIIIFLALLLVLLIGGAE